MRILITEDDPSNAAILKLVLEDFGSHQVHVSHRFADTLVELKCAPYDLLLLDYYLDEENASEFLAKCAKFGMVLPPFIYITGHTDPEFAKLAWSDGALGFIAKPFDPQSINAQIEALIHAPKKAVG
jgi:DNA-binding response OmpR family regulator